MDKELILLIFLFLGLLGTLVPLLPGLPLIFVSLLIYSIIDKWEHFSVSFIILVGIVTLIGILLDYLAAFWGAKKYGASKLGIAIGIIGIIFGLFTLGPLGVIIGSISGVVVGELLSGKGFKKALKVSIGNIVGIIGSNLLQFLIGLVIFIWIVIKIM
ncbi:MAG: DUF456 domain-containing protein [Bacillota bacterium]